MSSLVYIKTEGVISGVKNKGERKFKNLIFHGFNTGLSLNECRKSSFYPGNKKETFLRHWRVVQEERVTCLSLLNDSVLITLSLSKIVYVSTDLPSYLKIISLVRGLFKPMIPKNSYYLVYLLGTNPLRLSNPVVILVPQLRPIRKTEVRA